ncbi:hypothetical protein J6590_086305 [Homalodisca vitripennis]|nr:hypothetical protein J6590_086305 [Homalodisca vitripennis]
MGIRPDEAVRNSPSCRFCGCDERRPICRTCPAVWRGKGEAVQVAGVVAVMSDDRFAEHVQLFGEEREEQFQSRECSKQLRLDKLNRYFSKRTNARRCHKTQTGGDLPYRVPVKPPSTGITGPTPVQPPPPPIINYGNTPMKAVAMIIIRVIVN